MTLTRAPPGPPGGVRRSGRVWPVVLAALPVLAVLLALGTWQARRLVWKTALLETIAAAEAGPAAPLRPNPPEFTKVAATGRYLHDREALLGAEVRGNALGARLLTPFEAPGLRPVLVDRGWVPLERPTTGIARPEGDVRVTGYVAPGAERGLLSATDDTAGRRFFTADPRAIGAALGLSAVEPWLVVALAEPGAPAAGLPQPERRLPRPTNPHLGYAITWYGLAAALVGVVIAFIVARRREGLDG